MNSIWKLLKELDNKKGITEVIINAPDLVYIEREGDLTRLNVSLIESDIQTFCEEVALNNHVLFDADHPILDGVLPDGSRINIIGKEYAGGFPAITIRKYIKSITTLDNLDGKFNLTDKWVNFLKAMVKSRSNVLISGGTGVGKTTFLNLLLQEITPRERVVILEDTKELKYDNPNTVRLRTPTTGTQLNNPLTMRELVKNTLRMRPDRIIMGEIRGSEAFDFLTVLNTGHDGSMCTIHANNPSEALSRLENLFLFSGYDVPLKAIRFQVMSALDYIIQLKRDRTSGRVVSHITEVCNMEGDKILLQDIGLRGNLGASFTGLVPRKVEELYEAGLERSFFENL